MKREKATDKQTFYSYWDDTSFWLYRQKTINSKDKQLKVVQTRGWYFKKENMVKPKEHISSWLTKAIVLNNGRRCVSRAVCPPHHCVSPYCVSSLEGAMRPTCWHPGKRLQYGLLKSQNPCLLNGTHGINSVVSVQIGNKSGEANSLQHRICKNNAWQVRTLNSIPHRSLSSRTTMGHLRAETRAMKRVFMNRFSDAHSPFP